MGGLPPSNTNDHLDVRSIDHGFAVQQSTAKSEVYTHPIHQGSFRTDVNANHKKNETTTKLCDMLCPQAFDSPPQTSDAAPKKLGSMKKTVPLPPLGMKSKDWPPRPPSIHAAHLMADLLSQETSGFRLLGVGEQ